MEELIIKERELREKIANVINEADLPAFMLKPIIKDLFEQISILEQQQYQQALNMNKEKTEKGEK